MRKALLLATLATFGCGNEPTAATTTVANAADAAPATAAAPAPASSAGLPDPVATIGADSISAADLETAAKPKVFQLQMQISQAYEATLQTMIDERLLEAEAKKRDMTVEALQAAEIAGKIAPVTDEDVATFFAENSARMGGATLDQVKPRIQQYLADQGKGERQAAFIGELRTAASVSTHLDPFRAEVDAGKSARKGPASASIQIVEFSDFQCPYCSRGADTVDQVVAHYGDKVSVAFKHFPLPFHNEAHLASQAAECAGEQDKFWEFHDTLFENQKALFEADLKKYAGTLSLDQAKFDECLASGRHAATVDGDLEYGKSVGMSGTPGFYINGRMLSGAQPLEAFQKVIDDELARSGS